MCGRIVEHKERLELGERSLGSGALHLLRFIHDDDWTVGGYDINRTARAKFITLRVDDAALLAAATLFEGSGKSLSIDDHDGYSAVLRELVELIEIRAVVDKPTGFLAVMLHEVVFEHTERLSHALADGDARHNDDELAPAILFVEFKHRFDIDVGLACAGLHFDVEIHHTVAGGKSGARHDLVSNLHFADIGEKLFLVKFNIGIAVARFLVFREKRPLGNLADIAAIVFRATLRLTSEHIHRILDSLRLIPLYLKLKLH